MSLLEEKIDARVDRAGRRERCAASACCWISAVISAGSIGGAEVFRFALGVLVGVIVEAVERTDLDDGQRLVAEHADGQFAPADESLHQRAGVEFQRIGQRRGEFLARGARRCVPTLEPWLFGLTKSGSGSVTSSSAAARAGLPEWARRAARNFSFVFSLSMAMRLVVGVGAGEGNAARVENVLHLAVLAERAVQGEKREIGSGGQDEIRRPRPSTSVTS